MCGRYVLELMYWDEYSTAMASITLDATQIPLPFKHYNITPSTLKPESFVPVIRKTETGAECVKLRWGLVPFFARGVVDPKYSTINAKAETVSSSAMYRGPWKRGQRCIFPASGFYEWQLQSDMKTKVPYYICVVDQPHYGFAGLWDRSESADGVAIESCTMITVVANKMMAAIHNSKMVKGKPALRTSDEHRMPAILHAKDWQQWLTGTADEAAKLLQPYPDDLMVAWPVGARMNSPKNNGPELIVATDVRASPALS
jgi:putative SOS response-associated peptidase YedK